jgi:peptidylprolyl isomerase
VRRLDSVLVTWFAAAGALACAPAEAPPPRVAEAAEAPAAPATARAAEEHETRSSASDTATASEPEPAPDSATASEPEPSTIPAPIDVAAPPANAEKTATGLASIVLTPGTGTEHPTDESRIVVSYSGWTKDGKMFDSSVARNRPATFTVNRVIKGWTEALKLMTKGEKRRVWIPAELAYGDAPKYPGAPAGQLTFDIEFHDIIALPKAPDDVAGPPRAAKTTKTGLTYRVLTQGTGKVHPTPTSRVTVHYTGWTTDGKMFDSSIVRGEPATFGLEQVIPGWSEGVQLMVVGEKARIWIPEALAYEGRAGAPAGTLVFDVELIAIE